MINETVNTIEAERIFSKKKSVEILEGDKVMNLLLNSDFKDAWVKLYNQCHWSTVYQSFDFVQLWYITYHHMLEPVLIFSVENGELKGIISLVKVNNRELNHVGTHQAEYQTWLATESHRTTFIQSALRSIRDNYPRYSLTLKYLPEKTPLNWIENSDFFGECWVKPHRHPIMKIDKDTMEIELKKKNKKEKINRLKRLGDLQFKRITDLEEFTAIFDQLANHNDFRKGALYNVYHFQKTSLGKNFLLALFKKGFLHVTILTVGGVIIAANVGTIGKNCVHLQGLNAHSPQYVKYSPGILHFLMLGQHMAGEGFDYFDLTPGADAYKDALANEYGVAYQFQFASKAAIYFTKFNHTANNIIKSGFLKLGIEAKKQRVLKNKFLVAKEKIKILKSEGLMVLWKGEDFTKYIKEPYHFFNFNPLPLYEKQINLKMSKGSIEDLLKFNPGKTLYTKWEFMGDALKRLELGYTPYTFVENNELLCCIWEEKNKVNNISDSNGSSTQTIIVLSDLYFHSNGEKIIKDFLVHVYGEITHTYENEMIRIVIAASNKATLNFLNNSSFFIEDYTLS